MLSEGEIDGHTAFVTVELARRPEKNVTFLPAIKASTRWPPVTFANMGLFSIVGIKDGVFMIELASWVPLRTWYMRTDWMRAVSLALMAAPMGLFINLLKASLDGAKMVILVAFDSCMRS